MSQFKASQRLQNPNTASSFLGRGKKEEKNWKICKSGNLSTGQ